MSQQATGISHHTKRGTKPWRYHQHSSSGTEPLLKVWILERGGFSHQQLLLLITEREKKYILEKKQFLKRGFHSAFQKEAVSLEALGYPSFNFHQKTCSDPRSHTPRSYCCLSYRRRKAENPQSRSILGCAIKKAKIEVCNTWEMQTTREISFLCLLRAPKLHLQDFRDRQAVRSL